MPKKKMSDIVLHSENPPDHKAEMTIEDLSKVMVRRLGLKRKESKANHAKLLVELLKYRKDNIPLEIEKIASILTVSQSQAYEELRKWRTLGLVEFVKIPGPEGFTKGYMMPANTTNRLLDKVESSLKSFLRKTRRIAKDFDDLLMLEVARSGKKVIKNDDEPSDEPDKPEEPKDEPADEPEDKPEEPEDKPEEPQEEPQETEEPKRKGVGG
ncbi:hypothetical protein ACFLQN_02870 [Candidatus Aenigmatarchaeota archaeon]